jgi:uracil-DNA glycosylase
MANIQDRIKLENSWKKELLDEFEKEYMLQLRTFLIREKKNRKIIYPAGNEIFNALNLTPFDKVKVVVLGQDPYHGPNQAHGLCFSVKTGVPQPPSLKNIFQEIQSDLGLQPPNHGCLTHWSEQGVLLLNSVLTVEKSKAGSHQGKGWELFTDKIIEKLNHKKSGIVFLLWGSYAQKKGQYIDQQKHLVLTSPHPSPLSAHRGFFGNRQFSNANLYLKNQSKPEIDWQIPAIK